MTVLRKYRQRLAVVMAFGVPLGIAAVHVSSMRKD